MADSNKATVYYNKWFEALEKIDQIDGKIASVEKKIKPLEVKRKEINDEFAQKKDEFRKKAVECLKDEIRCKRKKGANNAGTLLEDDATLTIMFDEISIFQQECDITCKEIDTKIQEHITTLQKLRAEMEEQQNIAAKYDRLATMASVKNGSISSPRSYSSFSYSNDSTNYSNISTSNDSRAFEDALKRDREERFKHDEEMRKQEERARKEEAERRRIAEVQAYHAQMRRESEERREKDRGLRNQCNTCRLSAKCYMRGSYPCPTYTPR